MSRIVRSALNDLQSGFSYSLVKRCEKRFSRLPARIVAKEVKKAIKILEAK